MVNLELIKEQTLRHISKLTYYLDMSDDDRLKAWEWVYTVLWDYHRVYGPFERIGAADVNHFFDAWFEDTYGEVAEDDRYICGLPLSLNGKNCYSHMTQGY